MSVVALVRRPGFRGLLAGQGVSALGDWMGTVAFMALVLTITGSPTAVGGILALRLLPAAVGGPLAAKAAQRWDRRRTMLTMDAARAAMIAAVPFIQSLWWIYLWAFLVEVASLVFLPARDASIPDLVDENDLPMANGLILGTSYGSIPLGAALFAAVAALPFNTIAGHEHALVFWLDAATYAISFAFIARVPELASAASRDVAPASDETGFWRAFSIPLVRAIMPAAASVAIGLGALFSLGIVFVRDVLHASDAEFGLLIALFGAGAVAGLAFLQRQSGADPLNQTRLGVLGIGIVVAVFSMAPALWVAYLGAVAFGAGAAYTLAAGMSTLQSKLVGRDRILAFAAFHVVIRLGLGLAAIGAGLAGDLVESVNWPLVGHLEPSRVVLLCSGLLTIASASLVWEYGKEPGAEPAEPPPPGPDSRRERGNPPEPP